MKTLRWYVTRWWIWAFLIVVIFAVVRLLSNSTEISYESERLELKEVRVVVSASGVVEAIDAVTLAFEAGGTLDEILVSEGEVVTAGTPLVTLEGSARHADLAALYAVVAREEARLDEARAGVAAPDRDAAEAAVLAAEIAYENALASLDDITRREDLAVAHAREALMTNGLSARRSEDALEDSLFVHTPPTVTGTYRGEVGEYRIALYRSNSDSGYSFRYEGIESGEGVVSTVAPQPLGTRGLFLQFPKDFVRTANVVWRIEIPNTRASNYVALAQSYQRAQETREIALREATRALRTAEAALVSARANRDARTAPTRNESVRALEASLAQARAQTLSLEQTLAKLTLRAPFTGTVTRIPVSRGQYISPGMGVVSLVSPETVRLVAFVAEADSAELSVGTRANVSFDAYPDQTIPATVVWVSPVAETINSVASFRTILHFEHDGVTTLIRPGMSADIDIYATSRAGVVAVPGRALIRTSGKTVVRVIEQGRIVERPVMVGLRGTNGLVEIVAGLAEGDEVITFIDAESLALLKS